MNSKDVELCWRTWTPLTERAFRLVCEYSEFARQDKRLNDLFQPARALAARDAGESRRDVVRAIEKLRSDLRRGPRLLCEQAPAAFNQAWRYVPEDILEPLEAKIDDRFVRQTCQAILTAAEHLHFYAAPAQEDSHANTLAEFPNPLVDEAEIDALAALVAEMEQQQQKIDDAIREKSEEAQALAKRNAEDQKLGIIELALKLQSEGLDREAIRPRVYARMRWENPKAEPEELCKWWRDRVSRELRRHDEKK